jgi:ubiquinone/menaquinone biosynthesis C-methylase UbiE
MDKLEEIEIKRGLKQKYGDLVDRRIFCLGHSRVLNNPFYQKIRSQPGTLIDEGCGPGDDIRQFLKDGFRPIGVDLNEKSFELGFEWYKDADKIRPLLRKGDVTRLDRKHFSNASFKYSYSGSLIHGLKTVDNVKAYLSEVSRVLVPGGILFGSTVGRPEG